MPGAVEICAAKPPQAFRVVKALRGGCSSLAPLGVAGECFAGSYTCLADDGSQGTRKREAAMLLVAAEGQLDSSDDSEEALKAAKDAMAIARELGDKDLQADTVRLMVRAYCTEADRGVYDEGQGDSEVAKCALSKAEQLVETELADFRRAQHRRGEACMLLSLAELMLAKGNYKQRQSAVRYAEQAREMFQEVQDKKMEATALLTLVAPAVHRRDQAAALEAAQGALECFQALGDLTGQANALRGVAVGHVLGGSYASYVEGLKTAREAVALFDQLNLRHYQASELYTIAQWYLDMEEPKRAMEAAQEALSLTMGSGSRSGAQAATWSMVVDVHCALENLTKAVSEAKSGVAKFEGLGDKRQEAIMKDTLAHALLANGEVQESLRVAEEALELSMELNDRSLEAGILLTLSQIKCKKEALEEALQLAKDAVTLFTFLDHMDQQAAAAQYLLANVLYLGQEFDLGMKAISKARDMFTRLADKNGEAFSLLMIAALQSVKGATAEALMTADVAKDLFQKAHDPRGEAIALYSAVELHMLDESYTEALGPAKRRRELLREAGFKKEEVRAVHTIAHVLNHTEDALETGRYAREGLRLARSLGDKEMEVHMLIQTVISNVSVVLKAGGFAQAAQSVGDETLKLAKDAVTIARKTEDANLQGSALFWQANVFLMSESMDAVKAATDSISLFEKIGDRNAAAHATVLLAQAHYVSRDDARADSEARRAMAIFSELGLQHGYEMAKRVIAHIEQDRAPTVGMAVQQPLEYIPTEEPVIQSVVEVSKGLSPEIVKQKLRTLVLEIIQGDEVELDTPLMDSGVDSLASVQFRNDVQKEFNTNLPASLIFDYPNVNSLTEFLMDKAAS